MCDIALERCAVVPTATLPTALSSAALQYGGHEIVWMSPPQDPPPRWSRLPQPPCPTLSPTPLYLYITVRVYALSPGAARGVLATKVCLV